MQPITIDHLIRCRRKSVGLRIDREAKLIVRAPQWVKIADIERIIRQKSSWIEEKKSQAMIRQQIPKIVLTPEQVKDLKVKAMAVLKERTEHFAKIAGLKYSSISLSNAKTRWGSCNSKGMLRFNWRLIQMPARVLDYLVVHELMHLKQANHSKRYWMEVARMIPDYKEDERWLKQHGLAYL